VAEPSPSSGSLFSNRFQYPASDEVENNLVTGCPSQKNLPTQNFEGRREEHIQTKIKRKHTNVIVLSVNRQKPKMKDDI